MLLIKWVIFVCLLYRSIIYNIVCSTKERESDRERHRNWERATEGMRKSDRGKERNM